MSRQSFRQVFVTNNATLLASGSTVDALAVGQIGIIDAASFAGTTAPTYAKNKALKFVWGTPDLSYLPYRQGVPNQNEYSKLVKGKNIKSFKGVPAHKGQQEAIAIGWSGDTADTDTLFANPGEVKHLFVKLTGLPIDKKFSLQGVTRKYSVAAGTLNDTSIDPRVLANELVKQINADNYINTFVKASAQILCNPAVSGPTSDTDYKFDLTVCDTRDDVALGIVQAQYPSDIVKRINVIGSKSVYEVVRDTNSLPTAFSTLDTTIIPDCGTCPTGYTYTNYGYAYKVTREDAGSAGNLTTVKSDYSIASATELGSRINYEFGVSTYILVSDTKLSSAVGVDGLQFIGDAKDACVLTTPTTVSWAGNGTVTRYQKKYRLTVADDVCGNNRLTAVQAAFPSLSVSLVSESSGTCVHTYETTVLSNRVATGCSPDEIVWVRPGAFEGTEWVAVADAALAGGTTCKVGIKLEAILVSRVTNAATFQYFPTQEQEAIFIQASEFDPNYNNAPDKSVAQWAVKHLQGFKQASGTGVGVRRMEKESLSYVLRERSFDPVVREIEGFAFQADAAKFYDEYILEFDFSYKVGGWSEQYVDAYKVHFFFPEGQGKNFEAAVNGYLASANIAVDPVVL